MIKYNYINSLIGLLLITTSLLKFYGLNLSHYSYSSNFENPILSEVSSLWELFLGVWILSRIRKVQSWIFSIITFICFGCISFYLGLQGHAHCGCFGVVDVSPWVAFIVDVIVLFLLLLIIRPPVGTIAQVISKKYAVEALIWFLGFVVVSSGIMSALSMMDISMNEVFALLRSREKIIWSNSFLAWSYDVIPFSMKIARCYAEARQLFVTYFDTCFIYIVVQGCLND